MNISKTKTKQKTAGCHTVGSSLPLYLYWPNRLDSGRDISGVNNNKRNNDINIKRILRISTGKELCRFLDLVCFYVYRLASRVKLLHRIDCILDNN